MLHICFIPANSPSIPNEYSPELQSPIQPDLILVSYIFLLIEQGGQMEQHSLMTLSTCSSPPKKSMGEIKFKAWLGSYECTCSELIEYFMQITEEGWRARWSLVDRRLEGPLCFCRKIFIQRWEIPGKLRKLQGTNWSHSRELTLHSKIIVRIRLSLNVKAPEKKEKCLWIQGDVIKMNSGFGHP
jgi:hypothetical protein